jgi:hypothetical protein
MKRLVSTALAVALLLSLGALAVLARSGGATLLPSVLAAPVAQDVIVDPAAVPAQGNNPQSDESKTNLNAAPESPTMDLKWNAVALPLDSGSTTAEDLATYIESFCSPTLCPTAIQKVSIWDSASATWNTRDITGDPASGFPENFAIEPGDSVFVAADNTTPTTFSWVGGVPPKCADDSANCVQFALSDGWHFIMIPLEKSGIITAEALAADIGAGVSKVSTWDPGSGTWNTRDITGDPTSGFPENFDVKAGYPYFILASGLSDPIWP